MQLDVLIDFPLATGTFAHSLSEQNVPTCTDVCAVEYEHAQVYH